MTSVRVRERPFGAFERMLALRYLGAKREHGGLALISIVSVIGIMLGVWALILTMSIMNGFRLELISKIVGFEPHAYIDTRGLPMSEVERIEAEIADRADVQSVEPLLEATALATAYGRSEGIQVRGVRPSDLSANALIVEGRQSLGDRLGEIGSLDTFGDGDALSKDIVIGSGFAAAMGLNVGDPLTLTQPNGPRTIGGSTARTRIFEVSAIFHVGDERYDRYAVFLPIDSARNFFGYDEGVPSLGIRLSDADQSERLKNSLADSGYPWVQTWQERNGNYVRALIVERNVMRLILFIVVIITALNIITGVLMLVKNKARDVAILRTIGATRGGVVRIFLMTGTLLGMVGVAVGVLLGVLSATFIAPIQHFLEGLFGFQLFPSDIYILDALPAQLQWSEVFWVSISAFFITLIMSVIPSMWAARLDPVEALRFE